VCVETVGNDDPEREGAGGGRGDFVSVGQVAFWSVPLGLLLESLATSEIGIGQAEALRRLGLNRTLVARRRSLWALLLDQFKNPIILLLLCSAILSFTLPGESTNAWIIIFILLASGLLGFWQELSAADAVAKSFSHLASVHSASENGHVPPDLSQVWTRHRRSVQKRRQFGRIAAHLSKG